MLEETDEIALLPDIFHYRFLMSKIIELCHKLELKFLYYSFLHLVQCKKRVICRNFSIRFMADSQLHDPSGGIWDDSKVFGFENAYLLLYS